VPLSHPRWHRGLAGLGRVRILLPHSVNRYSLTFLNQLTERAPEAILFSRRLALAHVLDSKRRFGFLYPPLDLIQRRQVVEGLHHIASLAPTGRDRDFLHAFIGALGGVWANQERLLQRDGAACSWSSGISGVIADLQDTTRQPDAQIQFMMVSGTVDWAAALGAHTVPLSNDQMSEEPLVTRLAATYSGTKAEQTVFGTAALDEILSGIELVNNDTPIVEFAESFYSSEVVSFPTIMTHLFSAS